MTQQTGVVFDFDGTLADSLSMLMSLAPQVLVSQGLPEPQPEDLKAYREKSAREALKHFNVPLRKLPGLARAARAAISDNIDDLDIVPGIGELVHELAASDEYRLAVLSTNSRENIAHVLGKYGILEPFELVEAGIGPLRKGSKLKSIHRYFGSHMPMISIGDEVRDIEAARKARAASIAVTWGVNTRPLLEAAQPDEIAASVDELRAAIARLRAQMVK